MRIVFAGTSGFAATALDALIAAGHELPLILTQPDRPAGRGLHALASPVKQRAEVHRLTISQPATLRDPEVHAQITACAPDVLVVAAYGHIVPPSVLAIAPLGGINIHASLLPRWRGAAPIQRAILAGDTQSGVTIMQMAEGLDTGDILLAQALTIAAEDTTATLHDKLAALGARLIVDALAQRPAARAQNAAEATYAQKIDKREARIDWRDTAEALERKVRAFNPAPGAVTALAGTPVKIWSARLAPACAAAPGTVCESGRDGIVVACGAQSLRLLELQRAGGKRMTVEAFLSGNPIARSTRFGD
jgi:methionyl-tRNA formyltransferase